MLYALLQATPPPVSNETTTTLGFAIAGATTVVLALLWVFGMRDKLVSVERLAEVVKDLRERIDESAAASKARHDEMGKRMDAHDEDDRVQFDKLEGKLDDIRDLIRDRRDR